jgi:TPR repeat protein
MLTLKSFTSFPQKMEAFQRAALKGHEEAVWIWRALEEAMPEFCMFNRVLSLQRKFEASEGGPLAWYITGELTDGAEYPGLRFDFLQKGKECSWGELAHAELFREGFGAFAKKDESFYLKTVEKHAAEKHPHALYLLGESYGHGVEALGYFREAERLGWQPAAGKIAALVTEKREQIRWSAIANDVGKFWGFLIEIWEAGEGEDQVVYALGWGCYWHMYFVEDAPYRRGDHEMFAVASLKYYCSCVELQQDSIFTFLMFWNQSVGVKEVGQMIGQMVWEGREDNLVKEFET